MSTEDRRTPGAMRFPFEGLVEVGGARGPSFDAQAVNVSEEGMQLRTMYLPEAGQPLTCRFDAGHGESVLASGEVVWARGAEKGGEFGIRFAGLDAESVAALKRIGALPSSGAFGQAARLGGKVRLHIEGLASPMRAKIKDSHAAAVTVGSDLGFLQVGRALELEDATNGNKRPASIDRVEVAVDPDSRVPQLVVTLRYTDMPFDSKEGPADAHHSKVRVDDAVDDLAAIENASARMKGVVARKAALVGPAFARLAQRAKTTIALLAKRAPRLDDGTSVRRTTAPPLGGGLHASGRRVVRGDGGLADAEEAGAAPKVKMTKRKAAVASAVMIAAILGALAIKKSHHDVAPEAAAPVATETVAAASAVATTVLPAPGVGSSQPGPSAAPIAATPQGEGTPAGAHEPNAGAVAGGDDATDPSKSTHKHHRPAPFGNGPVHHGNVLRLKMDGPVEVIEGAQQPTGFAVKLPGRKSLEAAGPLAARDSRIAAIKVSNAPTGAELNVTFRDGVPNYQVSARGDNLVIALAQVGNLDATTAKRDEKGGNVSKHRKHAR